MTDKYYRLVTLLVNICPDPLRELFLKHASTDPKLATPYTTLDAYLDFRQKDVMNLRSEKILRQDQMNLIFPPHGHGQVDISKWDITLLSLLLKTLFVKQLQASDHTDINEIRDIRINLQHISRTGQVTDSDFANISQKLQSICVRLALSAKHQVCADSVKMEVEKTANNVIVDLGDVLRQWYATEIVQLQDEITELKDETTHLKKETIQLKDEVSQLTEMMDTVQKDTAEAIKTLMKTTAKRLRSGGKITKRFKTVDSIFENMRGGFKALIKDSLENNFQETRETTRIKRDLDERHLVVISGYGNSPYQQTALSVIQSRHYDDRCVLVECPSDWRHISAEDVDLAVFINPFGTKTFDEEKAKAMHGLFDDFHFSTSAADKDVIEIVIVTDQTILDEFKKQYSHYVIENPIVMYTPTTEDNPVDLVEGESRDVEKETDLHYKNLLVQSIAYCKHHRWQFTHDVLRAKALDIFRSEKIIAISGPHGSGKTTLALSLLSSYQEGHYLILTEPEDLAYIRFGITCVVVIEDLCGKYELEMAVVRKWFRKFDMLYAAVKDGILNVIITCDSDRIRACIAATTHHPLLATSVSLPKRDAVKIKSEPDEEETTGNYARTSSQITTSFTTVMKTEPQSIAIPEPEYAMDKLHIRSFCQHPDGSFLCLFQILKDMGFVEVQRKLQVRHYSSKLEYMRQYDITDMDEVYVVCDMCCTYTGEVVISRECQLKLYSISHGSCQFIKSAKLPHTISALSTYRNKIYVDCGNNLVYVMDAKLKIENREERSYHDRGTAHFLQDVVVCSKHKLFYIGASKNFILADTKNRHVVSSTLIGFRPERICAASEDSVFVLGRQDEVNSRIIQVNTERETLSDILLEGKTYHFCQEELGKMVFDRENARLVLHLKIDGNDVELIYLK